MRKKNEQGFTLIEVIVVAAIIAILAGILVPLILKEIDESKITRTYADARSISNAVLIFKKDTAQWPMLDGACTPSQTLIKGSTGNDPGGLGAQFWDITSVGSFDDHLVQDNNECYGTMWKGSYIALISADPWGNVYVSNVKNFPIPNAPVWIISAGPNGTIDTNAGSSVLEGDDIGFRMK